MATKIQVLKLFLSGTDRFEPGDIRTVSDERGAHFVGHSWAKQVDAVEAAAATAAGEAERAAATIQPKSATHAQGAK